MINKTVTFKVSSSIDLTPEIFDEELVLSEIELNKRGVLRFHIDSYKNEETLWEKINYEIRKLYLATKLDNFICILKNEELANELDKGIKESILSKGFEPSNEIPIGNPKGKFSEKYKDFFLEYEHIGGYSLSTEIDSTIDNDFLIITKESRNKNRKIIANVDITKLRE